jgi:hypothetical protein
MSVLEPMSTPGVTLATVDAQARLEIGNSPVKDVTAVGTDAVTGGGEQRGHGQARGQTKFRRAVVPVDSMVVGETYGRIFDDDFVDLLAAVLEHDQGLRHTITVTKELEVLAGHQWFAAVQRLGWNEVEVVIIEEEP